MQYCYRQKQARDRPGYCTVITVLMIGALLLLLAGRACRTKATTGSFACRAAIERANRVVDNFVASLRSFLITHFRNCAPENWTWLSFFFSTQLNSHLDSTNRPKYTTPTRPYLTIYIRYRVDLDIKCTKFSITDFLKLSLLYFYVVCILTRSDPPQN